MFRFLLLTLLIALSGCSKSHQIIVLSGKDSAAYRSIASASRFAKKINILSNNGEKLVFQLGKFANKAMKVRLSFNKKLVSTSGVVYEGDILEVPIIETGLYRVSVSTQQKLRGAQVFRVSWSQDIFVQSKEDFSLNKKQISGIASYYSPVVLMHDREKFFPSSLGYIFNKKLSDNKLKNEEFRISLPSKLNAAKSFSFSFSDIEDVLASFGSSEAVIDIGNIHKLRSSIRNRFGGPSDNTIYYCYFERGRKLYIRYYFLYSFDPKTSPYNPMTTHIFDRESFTLVYDIERERPDYLVYSSHLIDQTLGMADESGENFKTWQGGRLFLNWDEVPKVDDRPVVSIAEGSHAVFPFPGTYGVFHFGVNSLKEEAGGVKVLSPPGYTASNSKYFRYHPYVLEDLEIGSITSNSWNRALGFSGNLIDFFSVPLLSKNLYFPPFTERELDIFNYVSRDTTHHFEVENVPKKSRDLIKKLQKELRPQD